MALFLLVPLQMLPDASQPPAVFRFQALVSLMLSSQTKDEMTSKAMKALQAYGLTPQRMSTIPTADLSELIGCVSCISTSWPIMGCGARA